MRTESLEPLSPSLSVYISNAHRFSTDTILLAHFSMPKKDEICADFGTGCGAIPLIWCGESKLKKAYGVEIQEDACRLLQRSIDFNRLSERLVCVTADMRGLESDSRFQGLDLIACNPPYKPVGTGLPSQEESAFTARHEISCTLEDACRAASRALRFGGRFCICMRPERLCDAIAAFRFCGLEPKRLRFVQQRAGKQPFLFLMEGKKGARPYLRTEPVLFIEENGRYSDEMMEIYGDYKKSSELTGGKRNV